MKKSIWSRVSVLFVLALIVFIFPCRAFAASGPETTNAAGDTTYATIPHDSGNENSETFITVFTILFMIVIAVLGALVMYYKR